MSKCNEFSISSVVVNPTDNFFVALFRMRRTRLRVQKSTRLWILNMRLSGSGRLTPLDGANRVHLFAASGAAINRRLSATLE
jgi:hypothetical protein